MKKAIEAGQAAVWTPGGAPWSLSVQPAAGGSALIEVSLSDAAATTPALAVWHELGVSTQLDLYLVAAPVRAVRVTASGAGATVEGVA